MILVLQISLDFDIIVLFYGISWAYFWGLSFFWTLFINLLILLWFIFQLNYSLGWSIVRSCRHFVTKFFLLYFGLLNIELLQSLWFRWLLSLLLQFLFILFLLCFRSLLCYWHSFFTFISLWGSIFQSVFFWRFDSFFFLFYFMNFLIKFLLFTIPLNFICLVLMIFFVQGYFFRIFLFLLLKFLWRIFFIYFNIVSLKFLI